MLEFFGTGLHNLEVKGLNFLIWRKLVGDLAFFIIIS